MNLKFLDVINYEGGNDVLVWKHPCEDFNTGSHLIVHESQEALFMCNGQVLDTFGPGRHSLKTENIPLLRHLLNIPTGGVSPFHCEVYYINKSIPMDLKWGTPDQVIAMDPQFHILIHAGANGGMGIQIENGKEFLMNFNGTNREFTTESLISYFREMIITRVKSQLTTLLSQVSITIVNAHLNEISSVMQKVLEEEMAAFGVKLVKFFVSGIRLADEDYRNIQTALSDASVMSISSMAEKQRMDLLGYNWTDERIVEIVKEYAKNPASADNVGSMIAQMPVSFGFGQMLRGTAEPLLNQTFSQASKALGTKTSVQSAEPISAASSQDDPVAVLQKLKTMLDAGLISQEVYDKKMQEVLSRM